MLLWLLASENIAQNKAESYIKSRKMKMILELAHVNALPYWNCYFSMCDLLEKEKFMNTVGFVLSEFVINFKVYFVATKHNILICFLQHSLTYLVLLK